MTISTLPVEILERICLHLCSDQEGIKAIARLSAVSRNFHELASRDQFWLPLYQLRFFRSTEPVSSPAIRSYAKRATQNARLRQSLDSLVANESVASQHFAALSTDDYDALTESQCFPGADGNTLESRHATMFDEYWLSRHYWSKESSDYIMRKDACEKLSAMQRAMQEDNGTTTMSVEAGLCTISQFFGADPLKVIGPTLADELMLISLSQVNLELDLLAKHVADTLRRNGTMDLPLPELLPQLSEILQEAPANVTWAAPQDFHDLLNNCEQ